MNGDDNSEAISVIVITHNEAANITDCLDSLISLDYPIEQHEIIVIDSSEDATPDLVQAYSRVRYIRSDKGFSLQKNTGLRASSFEIVAFADADCIIPQDWLQKIRKAFQNTHSAGIGGNAFPPPGTPYFGLCAACVGHPGGGAIGFDANVEPGPKGIDFVAGCNAVFRKRALLDVGGYDEAFNDGGEDIDISHRLRRKGYRLEYIPDFTLFHKPRGRLQDYIRWNIRVGVTKFNLKRPSIWRVLAQPSFPAWSLLLAAGLGCVAIKMPLLFFLLLAGGWILYLGFLYMTSRPYPLLLRRRRQIGIDWLSVLTVVPFLVYVRQVCINIGQLKKWFKLKGSA